MPAVFWVAASLAKLNRADSFRVMMYPLGYMHRFGRDGWSDEIGIGPIELARYCFTWNAALGYARKMLALKRRWSGAPPIQGFATDCCACRWSSSHADPAYNAGTPLRANEQPARKKRRWDGHSGGNLLAWSRHTECADCRAGWPPSSKVLVSRETFFGKDSFFRW
jgi:hypothetical protein